MGQFRISYTDWMYQFVNGFPDAWGSPSLPFILGCSKGGGAALHTWLDYRWVGQPEQVVACHIFIIPQFLHWMLDWGGLPYQQAGQPGHVGLDGFNSPAVALSQSGHQGDCCRDDGCTWDLWLHVENVSVQVSELPLTGVNQKSCLPLLSLNHICLPTDHLWWPDGDWPWWYHIAWSSWQVTVSYCILLIRLSVVLWVLHGIASFLYCQSQKNAVAVSRLLDQNSGIPWYLVFGYIHWQHSSSETKQFLFCQI